MHTLLPAAASGRAQPLGRAGRLLGWSFTPRALWLLAVGLLLVLPAFWHPRAVWLAGAWDTLVLVLAFHDALRLPRPHCFSVTRSFLEAPQLGVPTRVEIVLTQTSGQILRVTVTDELHPALTATPMTNTADTFPNDPSTLVFPVYPRQRGEFALGLIYLRWQGVMGLAERWGAAALSTTFHAAARNTTEAGDAQRSGPIPQRVRVAPAHRAPEGEAGFVLLQVRRLARQRQQQRLHGGGREFASLREFQTGDELRAVSWSATARRGKLITRQFMAERSQQVWAVLDAGRLSRTALAMRRDENPVFLSESGTEREAAFQRQETQLDRAASAAILLAQVVGQSGDRFGLLTYGARIQQLLAPGSGPVHLRRLVDQLTAVRSDPAESDPLLAVARLERLQRRRGLFVWIAELPDTATRPALVAATVKLARRHLVVLVLLRHPELESLATDVPLHRTGMFHAAAAAEMLERRRELIAQLESQGVLIVEAEADELGLRAVRQYLEVKARGLL